MFSLHPNSPIKRFDLNRFLGAGAVFLFLFVLIIDDSRIKGSGVDKQHSEGGTIQCEFSVVSDMSSVYNVDSLKLAKALKEHFEAILEFSVGVYKGQDYFPSVYHEWISEEERDPKKRRNVVLMDADLKPIGYQSYMFQDDGKRVVAQALRIDPKLKGMGVGKRFMELCREFVISINPEVWNC